MYDLIIRDATIIHSSGRLVADIAVEEGKIAYVGSNTGGPAKEEIQGIGRFVIPGVIDSQVRFRGPGQGDGDDWVAGSRAAVTSGITTVLDLPDGVQSRAQLEKRLKSARAASVTNYGSWVQATPHNLDDVAEAVASGQAAAPYARMDHVDSPDGLDIDGISALFDRVPSLVGLHAEDAKVLKRGLRKWAEVPDPVHNDVRPIKAAAAAVQQLLDLVHERQHPVHICSMSTATELNLLDPYREDLPISTSVAPYHLFLSVETAAAQGDNIKVDPPVRTELDRRALWASIKRGRIDTFHSGHLPLDTKTKGQGYWNVPAGIPGVDTMFPLLMSAVKHGRLSLERLVAMCCEIPCGLFGIQNKGRVAEGFDADLVLFSEGDTTRLRKPYPHSGAGWTPYIGREVGVPARLVVVGGKIAARDGVLEENLPPAPHLTYARA